MVVMSVGVYEECFWFPSLTVSDEYTILWDFECPSTLHYNESCCAHPVWWTWPVNGSYTALSTFKKYVCILSFCVSWIRDCRAWLFSYKVAPDYTTHRTKSNCRHQRAQNNYPTKGIYTVLHCHIKIYNYTRFLFTLLYVLKYIIIACVCVLNWLMRKG